LLLLALLQQQQLHCRLTVHNSYRLAIAVLQREQLLHHVPRQTRGVPVYAIKAVLQPHLLLLLLLLLLCS
jgi:hypothetical protein